MRIRGALAAGCCLLLVAACTPAAPAPTPASTPTVVASPPETQMERQMRVAYEEAEAAYRSSVSLVDDELRAGGSSVVPANIKQVTFGPYLDTVELFLTDFKRTGDRQIGATKVTRLIRQGYEPTELLLLACVDGRGVSTVEKTGRRKDRGTEIVLLVTARTQAQRWKVYKVDDQNGASCP